MPVLGIKLWYPSLLIGSSASSPTCNSKQFIQLTMLLPANSSCLTCCPTCSCNFYFTIRLCKFTYNIIIHPCMQEMPASYLDRNTNQSHIFHGFPSILPHKCCSEATATSFHILPNSLFTAIQSFSTIQYELLTAMLNTLLFNFMHSNL